MSTPYSVKRGSSLWIPSGPPNDPNRGHLFIVLTDPSTNNNILAVPVNSLTKRSDPTCKLGKGDHPRIHHASFAAYYHTQIYSVSVLEDQVGKKIIHDTGIVDEKVFAQICAGVEDSRECIPAHKAYYKKQTAKS
jgi:hypothetical protein